MVTTRNVLVGVGLFVCGCAGAPSAQPAASPEAKRALEQAKIERERVSRELLAAPSAHRNTCEFQAGDCMVLVNESRSKLVNAHGLDVCSSNDDPQRQAACLEAELVKRGQEAELAKLYSFESSCQERILACTAELQRKDVEAARQARFEERKRQLETAPEQLSLWNAAAFAQHKVAYLRSTLPPKASEICKELRDVTSCHERAKAEVEQLEAELRRDDYEQGRAVALYAQAKKTEASCAEPEFVCLRQGLQAYGALPETRKWLDKNLAALSLRQELGSQLPADVESDCLATAESDHQDRIVSAFQIYVKQPVVFFRNQLERAFLEMHQAQVACLRSKAGAVTAQSQQAASQQAKQAASPNR